MEKKRHVSLSQEVSVLANCLVPEQAERLCTQAIDLLGTTQAPDHLSILAEITAILAPRTARPDRATRRAVRQLLATQAKAQNAYAIVKIDRALTKLAPQLGDVPLLVSLLKHPLYGGGDLRNRAIAALGKLADRKFQSIWQVASWVEEYHPLVAIDAPPIAGW